MVEKEQETTRKGLASDQAFLTRLNDALSQSFVEVFGQTSMHALPNIIRSTYWSIRLFWTLLLLIGLGVGIFFCHLSTKSYFQFDVNVNVKTIEENPAIFPSVSFCNLNPFDGIRSKNYMTNILQQNNLNSLINEIKNSSNSPPVISIVQQAMYVLKANAFAESYQNESFLKNLGYSLQDMIVSCYYNGIRCNLTNDFEWFFSFEYGSCYKFNSKVNHRELKKIGKSGPDRGLKMEIFVGFSGNKKKQKLIYICFIGVD